MKGGERGKNSAASGKRTIILDRQNTVDLQSSRTVNQILPILRTFKGFVGLGLSLVSEISIPLVQSTMEF